LQNGSKPEMTHHEYSQTEPQNAALICATVAPLLTALFDGEASASEQTMARAHLQACAHCTRAWSQWDGTRTFLSAASQAMPSAPQSLSERIHAACRTAPPVAGEEYARESSVAALALEETLFEAARGCEPQPFAPALKPFFADIAPPADLERKILRATVGARRNQIVPIASRFDSWREMVNGWVSGWLAPPSLRWGGALAAPALAALVFMLARAPQNPVEVMPTAHQAASSTLDSRPQQPSTPPSVVAARPANGFSLSQIAFGATSAATTFVPQAAGGATANAPRFETRQADWQNSTSGPDTTGQASSASNTRRVPRLWKVGAPRLTDEATSPRAVVATRAASGRSTLRPALYAAVRPSHRATSPSGEARLIEADFDETLDTVSRLRDDRPEDVRLVVDSYRAALINDERDNEADDLEDDLL
jgi:hypothetical protein